MDTTIYFPVPGLTVHDSIPVIIIKGIMNSKVEPAPKSLLFIKPRDKTMFNRRERKETAKSRGDNLQVTMTLRNPVCRQAGLRKSSAILCGYIFCHQTYQSGLKVSTLETAYSLSKARVADGILKHTLEQKSTTIPITIPGAIQTTTTSSVNTIKVPYYIDRPVAKPIAWWQKLFIWTGVITWVVGVGYITYRLTKFVSR